MWISRDELREVVMAERRIYAERKRQFYEKISFPIDDQEDQQVQAIIFSLVDPYVDYLMGYIDYKEYQVEETEIIEKACEASIRAEAGEWTEEVKETVNKMVDNMRTSFSALIFSGDASGASDSRKEIEHYRQIFRMGKEKGVPPVDVITNKELYGEFIRKTVSREEYQERSQKLISFMDSNVLLDAIIGIFTDQIRDSGGDFEEIYSQIKNEMRQDVVFQGQIKRIKNMVSRALEEETQEIYG